MVDEGYYRTRVSPDTRREVLWKALWRYYFSKHIRETDCVLELGCGYGHFINNVRAARRIGLDIWPDLPNCLPRGVEAQVRSITDLSFLADGAVDFVLASNLFEHVTKEDFAATLHQLRSKLSSRGLLAIVQPNYRYASREYFDDYTHITIYSHVSLCDFLESQGYEVVVCRPKFMPLTIKSRFKVSPFLIRWYLLSPIKPFGKQMLIMARPRR
jgi:SAM-dependent methyltransferase